MKKILCLLLIVAMIVPMSVNIFAADGTPWPARSDTGMPYRPFDNYLSMNNPPSFSWPCVEGAEYELKICTDPELENVAFSKEGIKFNVYNFNEFFETDIKYYWSVRYKLNGTYSVWSEVREFMISTDAYDNRFPEITLEFLNSTVGEKARPRLLLDDEMKTFLEGLTANNKIYSSTYSTANSFMNSGITVGTETYKITDENGNVVQNEVDKVKAAIQNLGLNTSSSLKQADYATIFEDLSCVALMYIITGEDKYLTFVKQLMDCTKDWYPQEMYQWNANYDKIGPCVINAVALIYDWLYDDLGEDLQEAYVTFIEKYIEHWWENIGKYDVKDESAMADMDNVYPVGNSNLYAFVDRSHQWNVKKLCAGAIAIYNESTLAKKLLLHILPLFVNALPFNYEDGSYNNGTYYYVSHGPLDADLSDILAFATDGELDVRKYAGYQNRAFYLTYQYPVGGFMTWYGDQSRQTSKTSHYYDVFLMHNMINENLSDVKRGVNAWMLKKNGKDANDYVHVNDLYSVTRNNSGVEPLTPTMLPKAKYFKDDGIVSMFSDVADDNKNALLMRSSQRGSEGHMHPDQNSFIIQALGENLLIDSDYYDTVSSEFQLKWNTMTYAHNTITYDVGEGQPRDNIAAKGSIIGFLNHSDFDLATGDATVAYNNGIDKFVRDIIYIRPDTYIIVDDLDALKDSESEFEWWVHSMGNMKLYDSKKGVHITKNEAAVDIKVAYPNVTPYYTDEFAGPDGISSTIPKGKQYLGDVHLYFKTEPVKETKIVSYITVHKERDGQPYVKEETIGNILKLSFEDGTVSYIKLDNAETATVDGYTFMGRALTVKGKRYMVVDETLLKKGDKVLFESDVETSCAFGNKEISFSTIENEANAKVYMPNAEAFTLLIDDKKITVENGKVSNGITLTTDGDYVNINAYYGTYSLYVNDKKLPGSEETIYLTQTLNGVTTQVEVKGTINGNQVYAEYYPEGTKAKYYIMGKSYGVSAKINDPGMLISVSENSPVILNKKYPSIELTSATTKTMYEKQFEPYDYFEVDLPADVLILATDYKSIVGQPAYKTWPTIPNGEATESDTNKTIDFNKTVLQNIDNLGESVKWELEVPEDGYYDIVLSLTSGLDVKNASRLFTLGDYAYDVSFTTNEYNDIDSFRLETNQYLTKGKIDLSMYVTEAKIISLYKVGLIKSDK